MQQHRHILAGLSLLFHQTTDTTKGVEGHSQAASKMRSPHLGRVGCRGALLGVPWQLTLRQGRMQVCRSIRWGHSHHEVGVGKHAP